MSQEMKNQGRHVQEWWNWQITETGAKSGISVMIGHIMWQAADRILTHDHMNPDVGIFIYQSGGSSWQAAK